MQAKQNVTYCSHCGIQFECKADAILNCQCQSVTISQKTHDFLATTQHQCLCANCLVHLNTLVVSNPERKAPLSSQLLENIHYYKDGSYFVFTELYHYLKGTCCGNGCRHCVYGKSKI